MKQPNDNAEKSYAPHIALFSVQIFFGITPVVGKFALQTFSSYSIVGFRVAGAAVAFLFLQKLGGSIRLENRLDYLKFFVFAVFGVIVNQLFFFRGLSLTTAVNTSLLAVTIPVFAFVISALVGNDKFTIRKAFGIIAAAGGVIYLINPAKASFSAETTVGDVFIVLNSLSYAFYVAVSKSLIQKYGALKSLVWLFLFGNIVTLPVGIYYLQTVELAAVAWQAWAAIAAIILFPTIMAYYWNAWALARVEPSLVAVYIYLQPLIGFISAIIFLGEKFTFRLLISAALIFAGVFFVTRKKRRIDVNPADKFG